MTPLESALAAWIAFHAELGVDIETYLLPPATEVQIVEVEEKIGYRLPEDLRELYKIANGQWYMFDDDIALIDNDADQRWAPLFGNYDFMPLDKALRQYQVYLDIYTSDKDFSTKYNLANPDKPIEPNVWEVREGDAVDAAGWNPNWFTFAGSDANSYSVDMSPPHGGAPGQVVLHGADEYIMQVVGNSVTDLMEQAVIRLSINDEHRYQFEEKSDPYLASVFFDMDWRAQRYQPQEQAEPPAAYTVWMDEQQQSREMQRQQLDDWLQGRDMNAEQRNSFLQWAEHRLIANHAEMPPMSVLLELQMHRISQGELPDISDMAEQVAALVSSKRENTVLKDYAMNLASSYMTGDDLASSMGLDMPVDEALGLFHQFKLESGDWTQSDFNKVDAFLGELQTLPIDRNGNFGMNMNSDILSICKRTFDEQTYKSDEVCYDIDLNSFDGADQ